MPESLYKGENCSSLSACAGNIYGAVPNNAARNASIVLMIIHQAVAYALYVTPGRQHLSLKCLALSLTGNDDLSL